MKNFRHKTVVITGAASGMGLAYAEEFAYLGARIAVCDVNAPVLGVVAEELAKIVGQENVYAQPVDVADREQVFGFAEAVKQHLGNAHVVINNAGVSGDATPFFHAGLDGFERLMRINFNGVVYGTKAFLPQLVANGEGALVNVSSIFGLVGVPGASDYCASKFAVRGFTESLMAEFYKSPIQIHCLHPGGIDTNIADGNANAKFVQEKLITPPNEIVRYVIDSIRKGRSKIVYGNESLRTWFVANFIPVKLFLQGFWREALPHTDTSGYADFNPHLAERSKAEESVKG